jgi:tetratricopeptide (TPR) repeat protein
MKYTITRALAELKLLKERYTKEVSYLELVAVKHGNKLRPPYSQYKEEDFTNHAKSLYQSICDLEKRITEIKNRIDISNFNTKVVIGDCEMSIQEVLNYKNNVLSLKESRLYMMKELKRKALLEYDKAISENKQRVDKITADKNSGSTVKTVGEVEEDAITFVEKLYEVSMIDPINIDEEIERLENEIETFKHNIDFVLSESNSITSIEIDD